MKTADELPADCAQHAGRRATRETSLVRHILRALLARGEPISVHDIVAASGDGPAELIYETLVALDDEEIISLGGQHIDSAPPLCGRPTDFAVRVSGAGWRYAGGAVDALGVAVLLGGLAEIRSSCHDCNEPLRLSAGPHGLEAGAAGIVLWVGRDFHGRGGGGGRHGPATTFFQSEAHYRVSRAERQRRRRRGDAGRRVHTGSADVRRPSGRRSDIGGENTMEIVRIPEAHELAAEDQPFLDATKNWFKIAFVPKMSRVLLSHPAFGRPYGRASRRAMTDGALSRGQKEMIAATVSAINVCEY